MQKVSLFLMTSKGYSTLKAIIEEFSPSVIDSVIGARDLNIDSDYYQEIKQLCLNNNIQFKNRKDYFNINTIYSIAISWRWLINLSKEQKLIVFHDSILPKYRGFSPLVNSLINGEDQIGVTALFANSEYDKGDIIAQSKTKIQYPIKIKEAIEINNKNYIELGINVIRKIIRQEKILAKSQDENNATYSLWRDEDDYLINWDISSTNLERFINAVGYPYKGAFTYLDSEKLRIMEAETFQDLKIENRNPGKIIFFDQSFPIVVCGQGLLKIKKLIYDSTGEDVLPLKKFRCRFK